MLLKTTKSWVQNPFFLIANVTPAIGVLFQGWTIFSLVFVYWLELIFISTFQLFMIIGSLGGNEPLFMRIKRGFGFFIFRTFIFFFYMIFIVVFLGVLVSAKDKEGIKNMAQTMHLTSATFLISMMGYFMEHAVEFVKGFILNDRYKTSKPEEHSQFIHNRILVVHIIVIAGTILHLILTDKVGLNQRITMVVLVLLFTATKMIAERLGNVMKIKEKSPY